MRPGSRDSEVDDVNRRIVVVGAGLLHGLPSGVVSPVSAVEFTVKVVAHAGLATIMRAAVITASKRTARLLISAHPLVVGPMGEESYIDPGNATDGAYSREEGRHIPQMNDFCCCLRVAFALLRWS